jgi:hypothetical protein
MGFSKTKKPNSENDCWLPYFIIRAGLNAEDSSTHVREYERNETLGRGALKILSSKERIGYVVSGTSSGCDKESNYNTFIVRS